MTQQIILKPEWMDKGDEAACFIILEDNAGRYLVEDANSDLAIKPTQIIPDYMINQIVEI